ncbi:hypothetical protein GCM10010885_01240 [Alicyclobacillus cellulosilyticus]|uniref:DUF58 domain-containing protein n=1 Tax=Alicyclobacillus cellulosilyticus TaxID=1003997 RepID=A0A917NFB1_9BACL|nr:DUF58 domain-containing protein [Alicyclobacillus cellulosilyticus]GGI95387.1 hypothetical protein GCM10010885_01240 [Alicyclobacillus cellulosilyticus]
MVSWFILVAGVLALVQAHVYRRYGLRNVTYTAGFRQATAMAGETVEFVERIANRKVLPVPWVRLEMGMSVHLRFARQANLEIAEGEYHQVHRSLFALGSYRQITRRHRVLCVKRGYYRIASASMTCGDALGLAAAHQSVPLAAALLVYPRVLRWEELPLPVHRWLGEVTVRRWIVDDPFLTAGVRAYRPGDPWRDIHWKASARAGSLQVRQREKTADPTLVICLNMEDSEGMWGPVSRPDVIERAIEVAASVAAYAIRQGMAVGLLCNGVLADAAGAQAGAAVEVPPASGEAQWARLLEVFAKLEVVCRSGFYGLLEAEIAKQVRDRDYLLISVYTNPRLSALAERLRRLGNGVAYLPVPAASPKAVPKQDEPAEDVPVPAAGLGAQPPAAGVKA